MCQSHVFVIKEEEDDIYYYTNISQYCKNDGHATLYLMLFSPLCLRPRRPGRWHRHRSPLADGHEGWRLPHWLLVQPRALLLEVQRNHFSGARPLPPVADVGRANNRGVGGRSRLLAHAPQRLSMPDMNLTNPLK